MMQKRFFALLCAVLMCGGTASSLVSCGGNSRGDTVTSGNGTNAPAAETEKETETSYTADLPAGLNYDGAAFNIVVYDDSNATWYDVDFSADEETGDLLNDAAFRRTAAVEQLLNVDIVACPSSNYGYDAVKKSVIAGEGAYDAGFVNTRNATTLAESGYLLDLNDLGTLDLSAPWWDQNAVHDLTVGGKLYMVTGDISIMYKKSIGVLLFNKQMLADYDLDDPYQLVRDKKWTIDRYNEMASTVSTDVNGDGQFDMNDKYGLLYYCDLIALGLIGGGTKFTTKNADDYPEITFYNEHTQSIFDKYTTVMYNPELSLSWSRLGVSNDDIIAMFRNNQGLFNFNEFHSIENMRKMDTAFGILPIPLYDETQTRYYHTINPHVAAMLLVPGDCPDPERAGYVLDALGAESKNTLTPAYYEQYLKSKGSRDNESEEMLDIIFSTLTYDIGYLYDFGGLGGMTLTMVNNYQSDLASQYAALAPKAQSAIEKTISAYKENG
ncbi:MAG: extracellular solute-binding protein [Clostridia bacterium]|nr:extracellular solute-binding protein [Clostridia bacterium]